MHTRRQFISSAGASAAAILAPQALLPELAGAQGRRRFRGASFDSGVLSGDPSPDGITLLTRLFDVEGRGRVMLEVATDRSFRKVVARRSIPTGGDRGHSVKARVRGLDAAERYYYRFETAGESSPVGRFRTAPPPGSTEPVTIGIFSCANYTHGWFNVYEAMARDDDLDVIVNLGDYVYAESYHSRANGEAVRDDRIGRVPPDDARAADVVREALTLEHYRAKYALYRSDAALRKLHRVAPMISIWDDHEVVNNYAGGAGATGGLPPEERYSLRRRQAGVRAYFENMPTFGVGPSRRIYRSFRLGGHAELVMLDERRYRQDQPCGDEEVSRDCPERRTRRMLGARQMQFLKDRLARSTATWKLVGNGVPIQPAKVGTESYREMDAWHGYLSDREEVIQHIRDRQIRDVAFLTGDFHIFFAGDVRPGESADPATTVAPEFVVGSVTSENLGERGVAVEGGRLEGNHENPNTPPVVYDALRGFNPWVDQADFDHHGYGVVRASGTDLQVRFKRLQTIRRRGALARLPDLAWTVERGRPSIKGQQGPS